MYVYHTVNVSPMHAKCCMVHVNHYYLHKESAMFLVTTFLNSSHDELDKKQYSKSLTVLSLALILSTTLSQGTSPHVGSEMLNTAYSKT